MTTKTTGQHTEGPWSISKIASYMPQYSIHGGEKDRDLAIVTYTDNAKENAVLMAAAPNLLAALQDFIDAATESSKNESYKANAYGFMMAVLPKARAAIKSATKET